MKEKVFNTDKFLSALKQTLDSIASGFENDMILDAIIVATRLKEDDDNAISHMQEIGNLAEMISNHNHDCRTLFEEFDNKFRKLHGEGKEQANALDAMAIITDIGRSNLAPHVEWLFEPNDMTLQNIFNDSFITAE